jgi:hypothetical protein
MSNIGLTTNPYQHFTVENSLLEYDLKQHMTENNVRSVRVMETPIGFYILVRCWKPIKREYFLCARRNQTIPKLFVNLNRVNKYLRQNAMTAHLVVIRDQPVPPTAKSKKNSLLNPENLKRVLNKKVKAKKSLGK